ncbi:MAG: tRNA (N(6)-L-threonylcarbamoyladenosine(37)-C(2))-methylthiotransferase MtaB [Desulfomonilaceae bacterium]
MIAWINVCVKSIMTRKSHLPKKALVRVLGCKVNQAEAEAMARELESLGYCIEPTAGTPDVVVVNTCCVTSKAEGKSRRMVSGLAHKFPGARMIVTGCLAEINPSSLESAAPGAVLLGAFAKDRLREFIDEAANHVSIVADSGPSPCTTSVDRGLRTARNRARAFLKVQDGCSQSCAYCIVPSARGPSRSLPLDQLLLCGRNMDSDGFAEIVLTGVHLGRYGRDFHPPMSLEDLLERLLEECPSTRFRLSSVEPQEITPRLIELVASHRRVCPHFHIPLQSGDDNILRRMRRPYDTAFIRQLIDRIFARVPQICIGLDIMVGFPGEDERSFRKTVTLIEGSGAAYLHVFPFSPRPGTPAASFEPRVPEGIARQRVKELRLLSQTLRHRFYKRFVGSTLSVVRESGPDPDTGFITARTDNYIAVLVGAAPGTTSKHTFPVTLERVVGEKMFGAAATIDRK